MLFGRVEQMSQFFVRHRPDEVGIGLLVPLYIPCLNSFMGVWKEPLRYVTCIMFTMHPPALISISKNYSTFADRASPPDLSVVPFICFAHYSPSSGLMSAPQCGQNGVSALYGIEQLEQREIQ
jgi:hypothetical protein